MKAGIYLFLYIENIRLLKILKLLFYLTKMLDVGQGSQIVIIGA